MDSNSFIQLPDLNFPEKYHFRLKKTDKDVKVFCPLRKKWLVLTPEEWVRQHIIQYFHQELRYPLSVLKAEYPIEINGLHQRVDILIFNKEEKHILCECKKPSVDINQSVLNQALRYAQEIKTEYLFLSNGLLHVTAKLDYELKSIDFVSVLPVYS